VGVDVAAVPGAAAEGSQPLRERKSVRWEDLVGVVTEAEVRAAQEQEMRRRRARRQDKWDWDGGWEEMVWEQFGLEEGREWRID
jgi:hypothetical protein